MDRFAELNRQVSKNEQKALDKRWTPNTDGSRQDIVHKGRTLLVGGKAMIADDVRLIPVKHGAHLTIERGNGERPTTYILNGERSPLVIGVESLARRFREGVVNLGHKINRALSIEDYMRY